MHDAVSGVQRSHLSLRSTSSALLDGTARSHCCNNPPCVQLQLNRTIAGSQLLIRCYSRRSYSNRISFYLQKIFACDVTGRSGLDFYTALNCERRESEGVRTRFPEPLKGKVLFSVQFRTPASLTWLDCTKVENVEVLGRLDTLVDHIFERYKDRFFAGEACNVDLAGDKYVYAHY